MLLLIISPNSCTCLFLWNDQVKYICYFNNSISAVCNQLKVKPLTFYSVESITSELLRMWRKKDVELLILC